ncbi:MAG TPA: maleylpyruvate isomerase N-terminal domain-containing protein [Nocardioidaceae bacterium]|nr:maleylpyruvate isomerase N-terminal domain-containing protein [Nocardioidaceae bacterium]
MTDLRRFWPPWLDDAVRAEVQAAYAGRVGGYHDLRHLTEVLEHVEELMPPDDPAREAVLLAGWFHDVVYDGKADDEERSARRAETVLAGTGLEAEVGRLVRLTSTHRPAAHDRPGQVLCDADLAVLAAGPERYAAYVHGVRAEYSAVSDADFAAGRAAVLRDLLAKPTLYSTPEARERWEPRARGNVEREVRSLTRRLAVGSAAGAGESEDRSGASLVDEAYDGMIRALAGVDEQDSWRPTACTGWAVRDLTHHCLADAQRALVALHTPTREKVDRDAVTYWSDWAPDDAAAAQGRRFTRVGASMFLAWEQLRALYVDTARAVVHAGAASDPTGRVRTQGHVLRADDLLRTLTVEATLHHLDLVADLPGAPGPAAAGLAEVRRVLDGLLGASPALDWDDERYARVATGRAGATERELRLLGPMRDRLPLFA